MATIFENDSNRILIIERWWHVIMAEKCIGGGVYQVVYSYVKAYYINMKDYDPKKNHYHILAIKI